jgi:hypothetical protein
MSEVSPIGLPNLVSQGDLLARTRGAQVGAEQVLREQAAVELRRTAERRAEQVQEAGRVQPSGRRRRDEQRRGARDDREGYDLVDEVPDDEPDEGHHLDVTA